MIDKKNNNKKCIKKKKEEEKERRQKEKFWIYVSYAKHVMQRNKLEV